MYILEYICKDNFQQNEFAMAVSDSKEKLIGFIETLPVFAKLEKYSENTYIKQQTDPEVEIMYTIRKIQTIG